MPNGIRSILKWCAILAMALLEAACGKAEYSLSAAMAERLNVVSDAAAQAIRSSLAG